MKLLDDAELARLLGDERPEPDSEFSRELDEWAAAGFPRGGWRPGDGPPSESPARRLFDRLTAVPPRRLIAPVAACATVVLIGGVAISQLADGGGEADPAVTLESADGGGSQGTAESLDVPAAPEPVVPESAGGESVVGAPDDATAGAAPGLERLESAPIIDDGRRVDREVHQEVDLTLSTQPEDLRDVADGVIDVTDRHGGLVVRSDVSSVDPTDGRDASGRASFKLRIPAAELQPALDELSDLAHVASRSDGAVDITNKFRTVEREMEQLTRERERLVEELAEADSVVERRRIRAEIDSIDAQLRAASARHDQLEQRVKMVPVTVTLVGEGEPDDGAWGISDALEDAGQVLTTSLGVLLVGSAVVIPIALLILVSAWAWRGVANQRRERALDAS